MKIEKVNLQGSGNLSKLFTYTKVGPLNDHVLHIIRGEDRIPDFHVHGDSDEMFYVR